LNPVTRVPCSDRWQARIESATSKEKETLKSLEQKGKSAFSLAQHVIPLTQLKSRQDAFDVALHVCATYVPSSSCDSAQATNTSVDDLNQRLADTARAMREALDAAIANMVTKAEFQVG
jgi:hypothetical protein